MTSERETPLEVANELPYTRAIRWLGAGGGILVACIALMLALLLAVLRRKSS